MRNGVGSTEEENTEVEPGRCSGRHGGGDDVTVTTSPGKTNDGWRGSKQGQARILGLGIQNFGQVKEK